MMENIPNPLPLFMCKALPDLKALNALIRASPVYAEVFASHAAEISEEIMARSLHQDLVVLMRSVVILHCQPEIIQSTEDPATALDILYAAAAGPLPMHCPHPTLLNTVRLFTLIHDLTTAIMEAKFDYLRTIHFEHLEDSSILYVPHSKPWPDFTAREYEIGNLSPPSWIEEQRVMRALLRISLFSDLAGLVAPRSLSSRPGSSDDFQTICPWAPGDILAQLRDTLASVSRRTSQYLYEQDEFDEVLNSLVKLNYANSASGSVDTPMFPWLPFEHESCETTTGSGPAESANIGLKYRPMPFAWVPRLGNAPASPAYPPHIQKSIPQRHDKEYILYIRQQTPHFMNQGSAMFEQFQDLSQSTFTLALRGADWKVLRPLGLGLWDKQRLAEQLELCMIPRPIASSPKNGSTYVPGVDNVLGPADQIFTLKRLYEGQLQKKRNSTCQAQGA